MKIVRLLGATPILAAVLAVLGGCSRAPTLSLRYSREAEYTIPAAVKRLAIAQFSGKSKLDARWAEIACNKLGSAIDEAGRRVPRYELVERGRLKEIMDEQDLQTVAGDAAATRLGRLAGADAVIYGACYVATEESGNALTRRRFAMIGMTFRMVEVDTARRLLNLSISREYDSSKAGDSWLDQPVKLLGGSRATPTEKALDNLATECALALVAKIAPHQVTVEVPLEKGTYEKIPIANWKLLGAKDKLVGAGNKLAKTGEYAVALDYYKRAIVRDGQDYGAIFNAGVMLEALRQFDEAAGMYKKAFDLTLDQKFADAWNRVRRQESATSAPSDVK